MNRFLETCGQALYGERWQSALARDLGVSDRTVRRWAAGATVPLGVSADLQRLCTERAVLLHALAARISV